MEGKARKTHRNEFKKKIYIWYFIYDTEIYKYTIYAENIYICHKLSDTDQL